MVAALQTVANWSYSVVTKSSRSILASWLARAREGYKWSSSSEAGERKRIGVSDERERERRPVLHGFTRLEIGFSRAPSWGGGGTKWWDREMSIKDSLVEWISELLSSLVMESKRGERAD
ncbi:uncharacterized protein BO87DRAFT_168253 [Aspergillus neoniger CBS 115656]|uniref:Uncharacterized protein n=1 Tax=Aspergillus neoniger (strain CBS 115656) TaxID=1448310 RepID=A0A318Z0E7_ASPNB|nr:hypothetical protein BO87DRAFT_168253 [Aspergillus neoniger CBS 115656]PYH38453.1 hypothetical protein BO87DRAFT_168253 [Aspergillus neoniger CBS 115656]